MIVDTLSAVTLLLLVPGIKLGLFLGSCSIDLGVQKKGVTKVYTSGELQGCQDFKCGSKPGYHLEAYGPDAWQVASIR